MHVQVFEKWKVHRSMHLLSRGPARDKSSKPDATPLTGMRGFSKRWAGTWTDLTGRHILPGPVDGRRIVGGGILADRSSSKVKSSNFLWSWPGGFSEKSHMCALLHCEHVFQAVRGPSAPISQSSLRDSDLKMEHVLFEGLSGS